MVASQLHLAMFPWFAMGHITPYLHLSNKLAEKGHRVSFLIPNKTQNRFNHLNLLPHLIKFIPLTIPQVDGLPLGAETMLDASLVKLPLFGEALNLTQDQVEIALKDLKPDFVFFDFAYWIPTIAKPLGIKPIYLSAASVVANALALGVVPASIRDNVLQWNSYSDPLPYETKVPDIGYTESELKLFIHRHHTAVRDSEALCFRGCAEIEGDFADYIEKEFNKPVMQIGPILPDPPLVTLEERWANWFDGFKKDSVVYCALGSECVLKKDEFQELVLGLELTGLPFLARLRAPLGVETVEEALPEGFEERVKGRGVVHGGWIQQQHVLTHPSVGCFLSHCGYGSMWEALASTCKIVLLPHMGDQFTNTRFMTKKLKVAVNVERRAEDGWFTRESVCKAVKLTMDQESELGEQVGANHRKWRDFLLNEGLKSSHINNLILKLEDILK